MSALDRVTTAVVNSMPTVPWAQVMGVKKKGVKTIIPELDPNELKLLLDRVEQKCGGFRRTGDWKSLEQREYAAVFVYCEVGKGGSQHSVVESIIRTKDDQGRSVNPHAFTKECYEVWQTKDGPQSIPVALTSKAKPINNLNVNATSLFRPPAPMRGRITLVRADQLSRLDEYKRNGEKFNRVKIDVRVPFTIHTRELNSLLARDEMFVYDTPTSIEVVETVSVWTYLGKHKYWDDRLDAGFSMEPCKICDFTEPHPSSTRKRRGEVKVETNSLACSTPFYYFNAIETARGVVD